MVMVFWCADHIFLFVDHLFAVQLCIMMVEKYIFRPSVIWFSFIVFVWFIGKVK